MMAWLYLMIVILVFYTPMVGLGPVLLQRDFEITISGLSLPIPFTGSLRLLFYSLLTWGLIWTITRRIEGRTEFDIFYWLDRRLPFLRLRERWIYATRPSFSGQLAVRLAYVGLVVSLGKLGGALLLGVLLAFAVPQLIRTALPGLIEYLLVHFPQAGWAEALAGWIDNVLTNWLVNTVMGWLHNWLDDLLGFSLYTHLLAMSILVLLADWAYQQERVERHRLDIMRMQQKRKREQEGQVHTLPRW